jgi:hypothetical protein
MDMRPGAARIVVITLAVTGALAVLGSVGMLLAHGATMGSFRDHGMFSSMTEMCRGMMGAWNAE